MSLENFQGTKVWSHVPEAVKPTYTLSFKQPCGSPAAPKASSCTTGPTGSPAISGYGSGLRGAGVVGLAGDFAEYRVLGV